MKHNLMLFLLAVGCVAVWAVAIYAILMLGSLIVKVVQ